MPESVEQVEAQAPNPWAQRLEGMLRVALSKSDPDLDVIRAYLKVLSEEGVNPEEAYQRASAGKPNAPEYQNVSPQGQESSDVTSKTSAPENPEPQPAPANPERRKVRRVPLNPNP